MGLVPGVQALWLFVRLCSITLRGSVRGTVNYHGAEIGRGIAAINSEETNWCSMSTQLHAQLRSRLRSLKARAPSLHIGWRGVPEGQKESIARIGREAPHITLGKKNAI
jgi:hypothetical protein